MCEYVFREDPFDDWVGAAEAVQVRAVDGAVVGRVVRGEVAGCEKRGTVRFEPESGGTPTSMGIRRGTVRTVLTRLLRPEYLLVHGDRQWTFTDLIGENLLYFAVSGSLDDGVRVDARADWDGSVQVRADSSEIGRFRPRDLIRDTGVRVVPDGPAADPGSVLFGLVVLLPYMHRIYEKETELIGSLLE